MLVDGDRLVSFQLSQSVRSDGSSKETADGKVDCAGWLVEEFGALANGLIGRSLRSFMC